MKSLVNTVPVYARVLSGNATDQTRFGAYIYSSLSQLGYGLQRYIPNVAPLALQCVAPVPPRKSAAKSGC